MKPTYQDLLRCGATWRGEHLGIGYELSWHSCHEEHQPEGIWCWYIHLCDEQFSESDWAKLRLKKEDKQLFEDRWYRHWCYEDFPDIEPHCGFTFGELKTYLGRDGKEHEWVKIGCDYNHLWDREGGYWEGKDDVEHDVRKSIDLLIEMFPERKERCAYSGTYGERAEFYTAINGKRVHKSKIETFKKEGWENWLPAETEHVTP